MAQLYFCDPGQLEASGRYGDLAACQKLLGRLGLSEQTPFLLDKDGKPIRYANRWLAELPLDKAPSPETWRSYAGDFLQWFEFLAERGLTPLEATREDVAAYHRARRIECNGPWAPLSAASWNRKVSALESFYTWAVDAGYLTRAPFSYRWARRLRHDGGSVEFARNQARDRVGRRHATVLYLERDYRDFFLQVGLGGLLPNGAEDPAFRGRNAVRNRAFGELLAHGGLRVSEGSLLAPEELGNTSGAPGPLIRMLLPESVCKGQVERVTEVPARAFRFVEDYARTERSFTVERSSWLPERPVVLSAADRRGARVSGQQRSWASISKLQRRRAVTDGGGSALLFVTSTGSPLLDWSDVFEAATHRCQLFEPNFPKVTPHTLRHTFAVHKLRWLSRVIARLEQGADREPFETAWLDFWKSHNALVILRDLLGHASITTTQIYLDVVDGSRLQASLAEELDLDAA